MGPGGPAGPEDPARLEDPAGPRRGETSPAGARRLLLVLLVAAGAALRLAAATGDLWLDEIFALHVAGSMRSLGDALFQVPVEHHVLTSVWLHLLGERPNWVWYRVPALLAGTLLLVLVAAASPRGRARAFSTALAAASYPLVLYSSEARGYAPAALLAVAAYLLARRSLRAPGAAVLAAYWLAAALGLLAHLTVAYVLAAIALWTALERLASSPPARAAAELVRLHAPPAAFALWLWLVHVRRLRPGGGPVEPLPEVALDTVALATGAPPAGALRLLGVAVAAAAVALGLRVLARERPRERVFHLAVLLLPWALVAASRRPWVYPRYFVVCLPFFYLLAGRALAALARTRRARAAAALLLALYLAGNALPLGALLAHGRGRYLDALADMAARTPGPELTVGSDDDSRNRWMVDFYARYVPGKGVTYVDAGGGAPPLWLVVHALELDRAPEPRQSRGGSLYDLAGVYRHAPLSGFTWFVYRRRDAPGAAAGP